jgi:UDP-glucose 4-epimerase
MILVTGATGFVGRHVYAALRAAEWPVKALVRNRVKFTELFPKAPPAIEADLRRLKRGDFAEARFTGLVHAAAEVWPVRRANVKDFETVNIEGTRALLEAVDRKPLEKIVLVSSLAVYGEPKGTLTELVRPNPEDPYGASKLEQERLVEAYGDRHGVKTVIVRFPSVYGPGATGLTVVPAFLERARARRTLEVTNPGRRQSFLHVEDAAEAVRAALESEAVGLYIAATRTVTMKRLAEAVANAAEAAGLRRPGIRLVDDDEPPRVFDVDASKAERELGWRPRYDLEAGLAQVLRGTDGERGARNQP